MVGRFETALRMRLRGELDTATAPILAAALRSPIEQGLSVELDCAELSFIDGRGITVILIAQQQLNEALGASPPQRITISRPSRLVKRVVELCDLCELLHS